jgi:S-DNA-T family DNA segregation ATPase FtsK/SpoIIIE
VAGLRQLGDELERRKADAGAVHPPRYLIVYGLQRFRDLRRSEDDFGFGRRSENGEVNAAELLAELVREGPPLGMHVLAWCDTLINVQRAFDRRDLREFEQRVLFQMGVTDSSTLIDSPAASRLGLNRALFATEELSVPEKFRPYRLPTLEWLDEAAQAWKHVVSRRQTLAPAVAEA